MNKQSCWQDAVSFAARAHRSSMRKDGVTPYIAHPMRVTLTVLHKFDCDDEVALAAALLHDVIEDTTTDYDDLLKQFGKEVADTVAALSKDSRMIESQREAAYDRQLAAGPWQARLIKLADVYDNFCDAADADSRAKVRGKALRAVKIAEGDPQLERAVQVVRDLLDR